MCVLLETSHSDWLVWDLLRYQCTLCCCFTAISSRSNGPHLKTSCELRDFYFLLKVSHVGLFEIQILIVLPVFEDKMAGSYLWTRTLLLFCRKNRLWWPQYSCLSFFFLLRLIGVKISLAVEQICKMFLWGKLTGQKRPGLSIHNLGL